VKGAPAPRVLTPALEAELDVDVDQHGFGCFVEDDALATRTDDQPLHRAEAVAVSVAAAAKIHHARAVHLVHADDLVPVVDEDLARDIGRPIDGHHLLRLTGRNLVLVTPTLRMRRGTDSGDEPERDERADDQR